MKKVAIENGTYVILDTGEMTADHAEMIGNSLINAIEVLIKTPQGEGTTVNLADVLADLTARLVLELGHVADGARLTGPGLLLMAEDIVTMSQEVSGG